MKRDFFQVKLKLEEKIIISVNKVQGELISHIFHTVKILHIPTVTIRLKGDRILEVSLQF